VPVQPVQPVQPAQPALPPKPAPVKLTIDTDPEGASGVFAGKPVGITPYVDSVESGGPERVYTLAKDGFDKAVAAFTTDRDHAAKVVLRKKKAGKPPTTPGLGDQGVNPFD
jgi:hypothetical protein